MGTTIDTVTTVEQLLNYGYENSNTETLFSDWNGTNWNSLSFSDYHKQVYQLAWGLNDLELNRGDRLLFFMNNDSGFCLADLAVTLAGYVSIPLHTTFDSHSIKYIAEHSEAHACVVSNVNQLIKLTASTNIKTFIIQSVTQEEMDKLPSQLTIITFDELYKSEKTQLPAASPSDIVTIIYTSGTTGLPKGVALTQGNLVEMNKMVCHDLREGIRKNEREVSFLPLSHIFAKAAIYRWIWHGTSVYFTNHDQLMMHVAMVRPQMFSTVPHLLEKLFDYCSIMGESIEGMDPAFYKAAFEFAKIFNAETASDEELQLKASYEPVYAIWRKVFGGELNFVCSGGAALRPEICKLFKTAGVVILEGYGMTEAPVVSINPYENPRPGTTGLPFTGTEVKIDNDGEILVRGPQVMQTYYNNEEATARTIIDGWLHTGDIGCFDEAGHLKITDRKKNVFKMSTGEFVMPQPLETALQSNPMIANAVVIGEGQAYCSVLIFPEIDRLPKLAARMGIDCNDPALIMFSPPAQAFFQSTIDQANLHMPKWSKIKRFLVLNERITQENGLLTATLKVRRKLILEKFADQIADMYHKNRDEK